MPNVRTLQRSFAGGEVTPELFGRIDDAKYQSGAAKMLNFIALPQGPAVNRPGFAFVREVKDSTKKVRLIPFTYSTTQTMVIEMGAGYFRFHTNGATLMNGANPYEISNPYAEADLFDIHYVQSADVLTLVHPNYAPRELQRLGALNWQLVTETFGSSVSAPGAPTVTAAGFTAVKYTYTYVVTAIGADEIAESAASPAGSVGANLYETGCTVTISWSAVSGATRYNVYKLQGGLYGYIGQTSGTSIVDDNIVADLSKTPPLYETVFNSAGNYPAAVSYFEQRKCFAGTINKPQNIWMTKSGTESIMSYSLPVRDDDRISFRVAAREANTIRHIIPLTQLLLLTSSAEWRVSSLNSDAITPTTISVRPQSYVGASNVQPSIINNTLLYCAARGGHVRELAYNWQANGFVTGDMSLRATHLFDTFEISDMTYAKAPDPIVWFVSTSGKLLGLTYVPEQQVGAWHQHDTEGVFESCTTVAEANEDYLYVVVKRTINGTSKRYIERMSSRLFENPEDAFFVDSGSTFNGANTTATTVTVTGGTNWDSSELLTITASTAIFAHPATTDINDAIVFTDSDGEKYRLTIESVTSTTVVQARVDKTLPVAFRGVATSSYAFARDSLSGLTWLEGKTVNILADGAVHPQRVVTSGAITLDQAASKIQVGLPITADLQTLPLAMQIDGSFGQGRYKNVNKAWIRVFRSSGIFMGPNADNLVEAKQRTTEPYGSPPALKSEEIPIMLTPTWADSGQIYIRQTDPLPLTIVSLTLEVALGG